MRIVVQRVREASVSIDEQVHASIGHGLLVFVGVGHDEDEKDLDWLAKKLVHLRIFSDENDKMNLSIQDIKGQLLLVSQFTLFADVQKGNRPSFVRSGAPELANQLYLDLGKKIEAYGVPVEYGVFGADMKIHLVNDGPVTIWVDTKDA